MTGRVCWILPLAFLFSAQLHGLSADGRVDPETGFQRLLPGADQLAIYALDWCSDIGQARVRAAKENRPILLLAVSHISAGGSLYTGHC
jgi:hypothetical protein